MKINKEETEIRCLLSLQKNKLTESPECERIHWLRNNYLIEIARNQAEWLILYQDPEDKRFWELRFEHAEMQGGGPPSLINISLEEVKKNFEL